MRSFVDNRSLLDKVIDTFIFDDSSVTIDTILMRIGENCSKEELEIAVKVLCDDINLLNKEVRREDDKEVEYYSFNTKRLSEIVDYLYKSHGIDPEELESKDK